MYTVLYYLGEGLFVLETRSHYVANIGLEKGLANLTN